MKKREENLDDFLRRLEEQSIPDLSQMEKHLASFKKETVGGKPAAPAPLYKYAATAAAILLLVVCSIWIWQQNKSSVNEKKETLAKSSLQRSEEKTKTPAIDSTPIAAEKFLKENNNIQNILSPVLKNKKTSVLSSKAINEENTVSSFSDSSLIEEPPGTLALRDVFSQMRKNTVEFIINNSRDTLLHSPEGSSFLVPANSFPGKGEIIITLREFNTLEDMLGEKLTTTSNGIAIETGGMIHLRATRDGKDVALQRNKSIRWYIPRRDDMDQMQVFYDSQVKGEDVAGFINWMPANSFFSASSTTILYQAIDFRDFPKITEYAARTRGIYYIGPNSVFSRRQVRDTMLARYPKYHKVTIRQIKSRRRHNRWLRNKSELTLGDTILIRRDQAVNFRLPIIDTIAHVQGSQIPGEYRGQIAGALSQLEDKYAIDITRLGWINCDRFYNDPRPKILFAAEKPAEFSEMWSALIFKNRNSIMPADVVNNRIQFANIPLNEEVYIVCIGIKNGHSQLVVHKTVTSRDLVKIKPEPVEPEEIKPLLASIR